MLKQLMQNQRQQLYLYGGIGLIVVLIIAFIGYSILNQPPQVSADRLSIDPVIGATNAPITIVEYGAYGCFTCRQLHQSGGLTYIEDLLNKPEFKGKVKFIFVNYPVINPRIDPTSAEAAQCALDQSNDAFWTYHDAIYSLSNAEYVRYRQDDFARLAGEVGLDQDKMRECLDNKTHQRTVQHHKDRAEKAFVQGTPVFQINGRRVNFNDLEDELRRELGL